MIHLTPTEIILAITCAAIVLWLYIYAPKLINRRSKFHVEGTQEERERAYINACWEEIEGKRRKTATAKTRKKGRKQKKIVKMKKQPGEYVIPVLTILVLLNMLIYGLLN